VHQGQFTATSKAPQRKMEAITHSYRWPEWWIIVGKSWPAIDFGTIAISTSHSHMPFSSAIAHPRRSASRLARAVEIGAFLRSGFSWPIVNISPFVRAPLERIAAKWNRFADKGSRQINILKQTLVAKVFNPGSRPGRPLARFAVN
jgi:hypothetical protein